MSSGWGQGVCQVSGTLLEEDRDGGGGGGGHILGEERLRGTRYGGRVGELIHVPAGGSAHTVHVHGHT